MTRLLWDQERERRFEVGLDRGVLYIPGGAAVAWNGLTSIDEKFDEDSVPYYVDGVKYLDAAILGGYEATLKAYTYPEEFEPFNGLGFFDRGMIVGDQPPKRFGLAYRTRVGDAIDGADLGYKLHILFDVVAVPEPVTYQTLSNSVMPIEFSWALLGMPSRVEGFRPTAHLILDSTELDRDFLLALEDILYGTDTTEPSLPSLQELIDMVTNWATISVFDNGDGTWTASTMSPDEDDTIQVNPDGTAVLREIDAVPTQFDNAGNIIAYRVSTTFRD